MYKIVTCNCKRYCLNQLEINDTYSFFFNDYRCFMDHEVVIVRCKLCPYNLVGFARNYFLSISCSCAKSHRFTACHHCVNLRSSLNSETIKIFIKKEDLPDEFVLTGINKYLERYITGDPIFPNQRKKAKLTFLLISLIGVNFSTQKKPCEYFYIFSIKKK